MEGLKRFAGKHVSHSNIILSLFLFNRLWQRSTGWMFQRPWTRCWTCPMMKVMIHFTALCCTLLRYKLDINRPQSQNLGNSFRFWSGCLCCIIKHECDLIFPLSVSTVFNEPIFTSFSAHDFWCIFDFSIVFGSFLPLTFSSIPITQSIKPMFPKWSQKTIYLMWTKVFFIHLTSFFSLVNYPPLLFLFVRSSVSSVLLAQTFVSLSFLIKVISVVPSFMSTQLCLVHNTVLSSYMLHHRALNSSMHRNAANMFLSFSRLPCQLSAYGIVVWVTDFFSHCGIDRTHTLGPLSSEACSWCFHCDFTRLG